MRVVSTIGEARLPVALKHRVCLLLEERLLPESPRGRGPRSIGDKANVQEQHHSGLQACDRCAAVSSESCFLFEPPDAILRVAHFGQVSLGRAGSYKALNVLVCNWCCRQDTEMLKSTAFRLIAASPR